MSLDYELYIKEIEKRSFIKKKLGIARRALTYFKFYKVKVKLVKSGAEVGENACINKKTVIINPSELKIGNSTVITQSNLDARGGLEIGNNCIINDGVRILTATHDYNSPNYELIKKKVTIKDYAWLATDCKILPGAVVGYGALIGCGAVVSRNVPDMAICVGNPAKVIGYRKDVHNGFPTEKLVGGDLEAYVNVIRKGNGNG